MFLLSWGLRPYLLRLEAGEAEHADLVDDVLPVARGALLLQSRLQLLPHLDDAVCHAMDLPQPGRRAERGRRGEREKDREKRGERRKKIFKY